MRAITIAKTEMQAVRIDSLKCQQAENMQRLTEFQLQLNNRMLQGADEPRYLALACVPLLAAPVAAKATPGAGAGSITMGIDIRINLT